MGFGFEKEKPPLVAPAPSRIYLGPLVLSVYEKTFEVIHHTGTKDETMAYGVGFESAALALQAGLTTLDMVAKATLTATPAK